MNQEGFLLLDAAIKEIAGPTCLIRRHLRPTSSDDKCRRLIDLLDDDVPALTPVHVAHIMRRVDGHVTGKIRVEDVVERYGEIVRDRRQMSSLSSGIKQRTPEWYEARHTLMTASDIAQALGHGKFDTQEAFFAKKVTALMPTAPNPATTAEPSSSPPTSASTTCDKKPSPFAVLPHFKWGIMFEDVAAAIYRERTGCSLHEFGLLVHPQYPDPPMGASPDGITDMGVMVEIKCPYRRKITGEVMLQYYYQIQGQLEVCGLRHCDYLECEFSEYRSVHDFEVDVLDETDGVTQDHDANASFGFACNGREKGVFAEYATENGDDVYYKYCRVAPCKHEYLSWVSDRKHADIDADAHRLKQFHFWRLEVYSVVRVVKDDAFVAQMMPQVCDVWRRVLDYRKDDSAFAFANYLQQQQQMLPRRQRNQHPPPSVPSFSHVPPLIGAAASTSSSSTKKKKPPFSSSKNDSDALGDFSFVDDEN